MDLDANMRKYLGDRKPDARYTSFDTCFNYFQAFRESGSTAALAGPANIQTSCLQLGFYLASWGMYRGSGDLLRKSARHLIPVIEEVANTAASLWEIDVDCYTEFNIEKLLALAARIRRANGGGSDILVTKMMLGVFGSVPAFDTNFRRGFGVHKFGATALRKVGAFYQGNAAAIDRHCVPTLDFVSGETTRRLYTRAKVVDMAFFIEGMP